MERKNSLKFTGSGSTLFGLTIVNTILTVITLGLYYPWAKVKYLKYYYQNTFLSGDHFSFHGTGKEIFKGFIKAFIIIISLGILLSVSMAIGIQFIGMLLYITGFILLVPIALHGTYRYRLARTSWRAIHFSYKGNITELIKLYVKGFLLTIVTIGIYSSWFQVNLRKYIYKHIKFGNAKFNFTGDGMELFLINLKGFLLTLITLGIYSYWYFAKLFKYQWKNTEIEHNEQTYRLNSTISGGDVFALYFVNGLIVLFTLGLGFAWAKVREMNFIMENIIIPEEIDTDNLSQTEEDYEDADASSDSVLDFLDIDIIF